LQDHFRRHGLPGTINLDPATRAAALELWQPDLERAREVLDDLLR
jgi:hypothetical protein